MAVRRDYEELTVITKTYDFILWSCNHTGKFPRNHRFVLGEGIERNLHNLLETLSKRSTRSNTNPCWRKPTSISKSSVSRCGSPRTCSASRSTATASQRRPLTKIGKLVGGWLKSNGGRA